MKLGFFFTIQDLANDLARSPATCSTVCVAALRNGPVFPRILILTTIEAILLARARPSNGKCDTYWINLTVLRGIICHLSFCLFIHESRVIKLKVLLDWLRLQILVRSAAKRTFVYSLKQCPDIQANIPSTPTGNHQ